MDWTIEMRRSPSRSKAPSKRSNRFRTRALSAAAAGVGVSAAAGEASATIIYHTTSTVGTGVQFDVDGTINSALEILTTTGMMGDNVSLADVDVGMMAPTSSIEFAFFQQGGAGPRYLQELTPGVDTVDGSLLYQDQVFLNRNGALHPTWSADGSDGYIGFTFLQGGTNPVYGWMRLSFDSNTSATTYEWAYDADGDPITVGTVPEPGTALLVGLGLAMLGVAGKHARAARHAAADG